MNNLFNRFHVSTATFLANRGILDLILGAVILLLIVLLFDVLGKQRKEMVMYGLAETQIKKSILRDSRFLRGYSLTVRRYLRERDKDQYEPLFFYVPLLVAFGILAYFVFIQQYLLGILCFVTVIWFVNKYLSLKLIDISDKIEEQLPTVIDTMIKVFSKYGDLKSVIYETSQSIENPLKSRFESLARRMLSQNQEKSIMEFADELNNVWIYSMVFILLSYQNETKKEEVIFNLRHLASIVDKESSLRRSGVTDKRYGVVLNNMIISFSFLAELANLFFNPYGKHFFFQTMTGIGSFVVGNGAILATMLINTKLSAKKGRR